MKRYWKKGIPPNEPAWRVPSFMSVCARAPVSTAITIPFAWTAGGFSQVYPAATWGWLLFLGLVLIGLLLTLAVGCTRAPDSGSGNWQVEPESGGAADNYISTNAREYLLTGAAHVELPEGFLDLDAEALELVADAVGDLELLRLARLTAHGDE